MGIGLRALRGFASLELIDRIGLREPAEKLVYRATRDGFRAVGATGRTFQRARNGTGPARQPKAAGGDLFDLTPTDEQRMMVEAMRDFAGARLRPAALEADANSAASTELLTQASDLGITTRGVPGELGGPLEERSALTAVLVAEALAHGDIGLAVAALAPGAVSTAIGLWGDGDQQATYLPEFIGESAPAAALAIQEPRALFDPLDLEATAHRTRDGFVLEGTKSLVPRAADLELLVVAAKLDDSGPALFVVETKDAGIAVEAEPAMGLRAAATGRLVFDGVKVPDEALLADGSGDAYRDCVNLARLGWCAVAFGAAQAVLDYVIPYVNERKAFGEPVSNRQAVAFTVSDIAVELEGMRLATLRAASRHDAGRDFARETAIARRLCSDKGMAIGSHGVQLLGGHGYVKEHPVERWYRDLRATGLAEGMLLV